MSDLILHVQEDMRKSLDRIVKSIEPLDDEQMWTKLKAPLNSIGNLCLHLAGNEYQNVVSAIGGKPFVRERSREFTADGGQSKAELVRLLTNARAESTRVLSGLTDEDVRREVRIHFAREDWNRMHQVNAADHETYDVRIIGQLLVQVAAHYAYHTGQIVLIAKMLEDAERHISGQYH